MALNKRKGNMYDFVTHMWSPVKGRCKHDCSYCVPKNTMVLMEDFSLIPIQKIKAGDSLIGIKKLNDIGYNKFSPTTVVSTSKRKAKTIILCTKDHQIECTPEHPLLGSTKNRGGTDWKKASSFSPYQSLRYIGEPISDSPDREIGWLSGFCDGDGCFFTHRNKELREYSGFEAVCVDAELRRAIISISKKYKIILKNGKKYNSKNSYSLNKFNEMIFSRSSDNVDRLKRLIIFKKNKPDIFYMGYIAGMIDSDGSVDKKGKSVRISQSKIANREKYNRIIFSLTKIGFKFIEEKNGIRINMDFKKRIKILFQGKPQHSVKKNRLLIGSSYKGSYLSEITKIEKGRDITVFNLQTSSENFIANGFIAHNCYMKRFPLPDLYLNEKDLKTNLGENNYIFVGHTVDLFADNVSAEWIEKVLWRCRGYDTNTYLFQSKNPGRFMEFIDKFPPKVVFGTTIETNRTIYVESKAPSYTERAEGIRELSDEGYETIVTIEPIFDFDLDGLVDIIVSAKPSWINIGADSKGHRLPEPSKEQIVELVEVLQSKMEVKLKDNLKRILGK